MRRLNQCFLCTCWSRPLSQPSQSFSGLVSESQHFALPPQRSSQLCNLQQFTQNHPASQLLQGSQATCTDAPLLASSSQPQSQMNLIDPLNPPLGPCMDGSRTKPAATPLLEPKLQNCRQMQLKTCSTAGLSGNDSDGLVFFYILFVSLCLPSGTLLPSC